MRIKRAKTRDSRENVHTKQCNGYEIDEHVIVQNKSGKHQVVKICDIWFTAGKDKEKDIFVTAQYYHFPSNIGTVYAKKIPYGSAPNEVFRSNLTSAISLSSIVSKCTIVRSKVLASKENTFFCRYHFDPSNPKHPFSKLPSRDMLSNKEPVLIYKPKIGQRFQAQLPTWQHHRHEDDVDGSQVVWFPKERGLESTYVVLATCLQLAVGNIVRTWDSEKSCHSRCTVIAHNPDGTLQIKFPTGRIDKKVPARRVLGCINEEMAMMILKECGNDTSRALLKCAAKVVEHQAEESKQLKKQLEKSEKATIAAIRDTDVKLRRGTRRASLVALQKIFSSA